jgi:translation initiation factor IF-1
VLLLSSKVQLLFSSLFFLGSFDIILNANSNFAIRVFLSMAHQGSFEADGEVVEALPNTLFRVRLADGNLVLCHLSGKMRMHFIKILPGDRVKIEMTPYDQNKGRIMFRYR